MLDPQDPDVDDSALQEALKCLGVDAAPGEVLRAIRKSRGLSLKEVASQIGGRTHFTTIGKLETGKTQINYDWSYALADVLRVPSSIFHMHYDSYKSSSRIPVYTSIDEAALFPEGVPNSHDLYYGTTNSIFGFAITGHPDIYSEFNMVTVIVDADRTKLVSGSAYLFSDFDFDSVICGIYRSDANFKRVIPWPVTSTTVEPFEDDMNVHGEIVEVRRRLVSRNR